MISIFRKIIAIFIAVFTMCNFLVAQCISNNAIYVTPNGVGTGSPTNPANLLDALLMYEFNPVRNKIILSGGDYYFYATIQIPSGINIEGGYRPTGSNWIKDPLFATKLNINAAIEYYTIADYWTNVSGTYQVQDYEVANVIGLQLDSVKNIFLKDFKLEVWSNRAAMLDSRDGFSIYGIHAYRSSNVTLLNLDITTGNAQNGSRGAQGRNGYSAIYNQAGGLEVNYSLTTNLERPVYKIRSESNARSAGGYGGYGGALQRFVPCQHVGCLQLGCEVESPAPTGQQGGKSGGAGGVCGDPCSIDCYFETYSNYVNAIQQFASVVSNAVPAPTLPNPSGRGGANGISGEDGQTYTVSRKYNENERYFVPATGISGQSGSGGSGGGGGGAGGIRTLRIPGPPPGAGDIVAMPIQIMQATLLAINLIGTAAGADICGSEILNLSTRGGEGGGGGEGGEGGGGGGGGGAVYGIFTYICSNIAAGNITYNLGEAGDGGTGGIGGMGGSGALGVDGPDLYQPLAPISNRGARGGRGGNGGMGGDGQDGKVGVKRETWRLDDASAMGIDTSRLCTNSIIGIAKHPNSSVAVYYQPPGSNIGTGQTLITNTPTYVEFSIPSTGKALVRLLNNQYSTFKSIDYNITKQRVLPNFNLPSKVCSTDTILLAATDTTKEGYYWRVYLNGTLVKESRDVRFKFIPPVKSGSPLYRVYLQSFENCCGWSTPVEKAVMVEAPLNLTMAVWNDYPFCEGTDSVRLTVSGSPSHTNPTPPFISIYDGLKWNTGDSLKNVYFAKTNGIYYAEYTSLTGCVTRSPMQRISKIKPRPNSALVTQPLVGVCGNLPVSVFPHDPNSWSYNFYADEYDINPLPNGYRTNKYTFTPSFTSDSLIIYTASVSYEGCVSGQRGTAVIHREKFLPFVRQPFTNYYHGNATVNNCGAVVNYQVPIGADNCSPSVSVTRIFGLPSGSLFPVGTSQVIHRLEDDYGNTRDVVTTIEVSDNVPPSISWVSPHINLIASQGMCAAKWNLFTPTATDNCTGMVPVSSYWSGSNIGDTLFGVGTTKFFYTAQDSLGNRAVATTEIKVTDTQPPVISCPPNQVYYIKYSDTTAFVSYNLPVVSDNCTKSYMGLTLTSGLPNFSYQPLGTRLQTYTATDEYGNVGTCSFTVKVTDSIAPVVNCPGPLNFLTATGLSYATISYGTPIATDNLPGTITIAKLSGKASGDTAGIGTHTAIWKGTDIYGNEGTCSVKIVVSDRQAPNLVCPNNIVVGNDNGSCTAVVNYSVAPALDNDGNTYAASLFSGLSSGASFPMGQTNIVYMVADAQNNKAYCTFNVTVKDTIAPVFTTTCPSDTVLNLNPMNCGANLALPVLAGIDNSCTPVQVDRITGSPSGYFELGATVQTYRIKDNSGNATTCHYTVTVVDNNNLTITCPSDISVAADPDKCTAYVARLGSANISPQYACAAFTYTASSGPDFPVGTTQVTYTVQALGKQASCMFNVSVSDNQVPTIASPANITEHIDASACGKVINFVAPVGTDNCSNGLGTFRLEGLASGSIFPIGTTVQTYVVSDLVGNTDTARFTITVRDTVKPTIASHADIEDSTNNMCGLAVTFTEPIGADNSSCVTTTRVAGLASGDLFPLGVTEQIYVVTDGAGNTDTCRFNIIVSPIYPLQSACMSHWLQPDPVGYGTIVYYPVPGTVDQQTGQLNPCPGIHIILEEGRGSGAFFPPGLSVEKYAFVIQGTGDTVRCSTNVVVTEFTPPVIDCGTVQTYELTVDSGLCTAAFTIPVPEVNDGPNGGTVTLQHEIDGSLDTNKVYNFSTGFHTIAYRATDYSSNSSYCNIYVHVTDDVKIERNFNVPMVVCEHEAVDIDPMITGSATGLIYEWRTTDSVGNYVTISTNKVLHFNSVKYSDRKQYSFSIIDRCGTTIMGGEILLDVQQAAPATISGLSSNYCFFDSINRTIITNPPGGSISGRGVSGNVFNPKAAGIGVHDITYRIADTVSGCMSIQTFTVTVSDTPSIGLFADSVYCINSAIVQFPPTNSIYVGAGVSGTTFNPAIAGGGNHIVTRTVTEYGCSSKIAQSIRVNTVIPDATITAPSTVCQSSGMYLLSSATAGGIWSGTHVVVDSATGIAKFDSRASGAGSDTIAYAVTKSACSAAATKVITIHSKDYNLPYTFPEFCTNSPAVQFDTIDSKTYVGKGFTSSGLFTPSDVGMRGPIFYAVITTNQYSCKDTNFRMLHLRGGQLNVYPYEFVCNRGDSVVVNLRSEYDSIRWWNGSSSNTMVLTDTGAFTVFLRDTMGCFGSDTMRVGVYETPASIVADTLVYACILDSVTITADSSFEKYQWSTGDTTAAIQVLPGTYTVTATTAWGCNYVSPSVSVVSGADTQAPTVACPSDTVLFTPMGSCTVSGVVLSQAIPSDNCGIISLQHNAPSSFAIGITNVTWTAKDPSNNQGVCVQKITVRDTIQPFFTQLPSVGLFEDSTQGNCSTKLPNMLGMFAASDSCSAVVLTQEPAAGTFVSSQITAVAITASDVSGNIATYYIYYLAKDTLMPALVCPTNITTTTQGATAVVNYSPPTQSSNCANTSIVRIAGLESGSNFPLGVTTVKYVITDGAGAKDTCSFNITVSSVSSIVQYGNNDYSLMIMPVPATDFVTVTYENSTVRTLKVRMLDIAGRVMFSEQIAVFSGNYTKTLSFAGIASGTYIVELTTEKGTVSKKVIKL